MRPGLGHLVSTAALLFTALFCLSFALGAQETPWTEPPMPAAELMRKTIANELEHPKTTRFYRWTDRVAKPKGSWTKLMVETPDGLIALMVAINDKPLTPKQRQADDGRINRLLDPAKMREKARQQQTDEQHSQKLLRTMPVAFNFTYAGTVIASNGHRIVKLDFAPNPNFDPPDHESQVYQGMKGQVWIDTNDMRLANIEGTLFRDVNFGWGIIGKLNKGGRFVVEQADVGDGHWDTTRMELKFEGKILMTKRLQIEETETEWDFHPVPKMSVRQALEMLRQSGDELATTLFKNN